MKLSRQRSHFGLLNKHFSLSSERIFAAFSMEPLEVRIQELLQANEALERRVKELEEENAALKEAVKHSSDSKEGHASFYIDTDSVENGDAIPSDNGCTIIYEKHLEEVLETTVPSSAGTEAAESSTPAPPPSRSACFNCMGPHIISECPLPRDPRAIAHNRREFMRKQPLSSARYHVEEMQRFAHIQPGLPSSKLSEALGLRDNQLPSYIYRMRELGYPPAWLKEAEIKHSGMSLYLAEDKVLADLGDEDGEISDTTDKIQYDLDKIKEWPGFNVEFPDTFLDETRYYRCPPIAEKHLKSEMVRHMQPRTQTGYVRGAMQDTSCKKDEPQPSAPASPDPRSGNGPDADETNCGRSVVTVADGTPIAVSCSPFRTLPDRTKWAKDTTDHILFENLPDSTGKWDQMREVLQRGRSTKRDSLPEPVL